LAPGGKWADGLEATGMVKAEAGRPGPYCLGRLILRHRIDAKRCSIDPTRSRHTASARPRGGGVYDPHQIDRRRRSPKGKKSTRSRSFVRRQAPAFITHTDGASISARGSLPFRSVPAHYQSVAPRGAEAATQGQCRERCAGCRPARDEFAAPRCTITKTTDRYQLGALAHTYAALVSVSELTDRPSPQCLQGCPRSGRWTIVWHSQQLSRTEFILAIRLWPTEQTRVGNARNLGSGPAGRASGPSFARLPTTVTARPRLGDPSIHFQRVEYATAGVGRHPDICQLKNQRTIICAP